MTYRLYTLYKSQSGYTLSETDCDKLPVVTKTARRLTDGGAQCVIRDMSKRFSVALQDKIEAMRQRAKPPFDDPIPF